MHDPDSRCYRLKEEVYFEPLFNGWYAWPLLMAPLSAARYTTATHLRLMKSFIKNHQLHIAASKQLAGGDFLYSTEKQLPQIKALVESTENNHSDLIALSEAIAELNDMLRAHTSGESLEPLYEKIPEPLKGYIELVFDLQHNASFRVFEALVYRSKLYKTELQSASFGLLGGDQERPFMLSTPRVADDNHLQAHLPFNSPVLKQLLASREDPLSMNEIDHIFNNNDCCGGLDYKSLFTDQAPKYSYTPLDQPYKLQYVGHAGFLLETPEVSILIDPVIASRDDNDPMHMISFSELPPRIDYLCLTHTHSDHVQLETLLQLRHKVGTVLVPKNSGGMLCDPSLKLMLNQLNFNVSEFEDLEALSNDNDVRITAIPFMGEHGDLNIRSKTAWLIEFAGKKLFFGADATCLDENVYKNIQQAIGDLDFLAIGLECVGAPFTWLYGALYTEKVPKNIKDSRRLNGCNAAQANKLINIFNPKQVVIYALGLETCYKYFMGIEYEENSEQLVQTGKLLEECKVRGIAAKKMIGSQEIKLVS